LLTLTCLIVVAVLATIMIRGSAAGACQPIHEIERKHALLGLWLNGVGGWLSVALIVIGAVLLGRRSGRGLARDRRPLIALFVAPLPAILIGLVALMYAFT
jgi:hypothetical protein